MIVLLLLYVNSVVEWSSLKLSPNTRVRVREGGGREGRKAGERERGGAEDFFLFNGTFVYLAASEMRTPTYNCSGHF